MCTKKEKELHEEIARENQKIGVPSKVFLCSVIMIIVNLNLHHSLVMVINLTSEGVESNPGHQHFAIQK